MLEHWTGNRLAPESASRPRLRAGRVYSAWASPAFEGKPIWSGCQFVGSMFPALALVLLGFFLVALVGISPGFAMGSMFSWSYSSTQGNLRTAMLEMCLFSFLGYPVAAADDLLGGRLQLWYGSKTRLLHDYVLWELLAFSLVRRNTQGRWCGGSNISSFDKEDIVPKKRVLLTRKTRALNGRFHTHVWEIQRRSGGKNLSLSDLLVPRLQVFFLSSGLDRSRCGERPGNCAHRPGRRLSADGAGWSVQPKSSHTGGCFLISCRPRFVDFRVRFFPNHKHHHHANTPSSAAPTPVTTDIAYLMDPTVPVVQVVQVPPVQIIEKIAETIHSVQGAQTSESLGTVPGPPTCRSLCSWHPWSMCLLWWWRMFNLLWKPNPSFQRPS